MLVYFMAIWSIVGPFGTFCGQLVYLLSFGIFFPVLVCCANKNPATLHRNLRSGVSMMTLRVCMYILLAFAVLARKCARAPPRWTISITTDFVFPGRNDNKRNEQAQICAQTVEILAGSHSQNSFYESHCFIESLKILDHRFPKTCPA
jgi:hypothetical protein